MTTVRDLPLDLLDEADDNVRQATETPETLADLTASIRAHGILVPLIVQPATDGRYLIVAGHRRSRAARNAGLTTVPATIRTLTERQRVETMLAENAGRRQLDPFDEARGYQRLIRLGATQAEIAQRCGVSIATVSHRLALLGLDARDRRRVRTGRLTLTAATDKAVKQRQQAYGGPLSNGGRNPVPRAELDVVVVRHAMYRALCNALPNANLELLKRVADQAAPDALRYIREAS